MFSLVTDLKYFSEESSQKRCYDVERVSRKTLVLGTLDGALGEEMTQWKVSASYCCCCGNSAL